MQHVLPHHEGKSMFIGKKDVHVHKCNVALKNIRGGKTPVQSKISLPLETYL